MLLCSKYHVGRHYSVDSEVQNGGQLSENCHIKTHSDHGTLRLDEGIPNDTDD